MTYLVAVDGVVRTDTGIPIKDVEILVRSLIVQQRVVFSAPEESDAAVYLEREGIVGHAGVRFGALLDNLREERAQGYVQAVLTPSTEDAKQVFDQGISVFLIGAQRVVNPLWRPTRKSWGEITGG